MKKNIHNHILHKINIRQRHISLHLKLLTLYILVLFTICSCNKKNQNPKDSKPISKRKGILFHFGFEENKFQGLDFSWLRKKSAALIIAQPRKSGMSALKVTLNRTDPMYSKGKRSELAVPMNFTIGKEYWYGFSIHIPLSWKKDYKSEVITQWFATRDKFLGEKSRSPSLALRIKKDYWIVTNRWDKKPLSIKNSAPKEKLYKGSFKKGVWTDWVFHVKWSWKDDGLVEIFKNGNKIAIKHGPNTYNDKIGPIMKFGIYKAPWNNPKSLSAVSTRTIFFDEIRIADHTSNLLSVSPEEKLNE